MSSVDQDLHAYADLFCRLYDDLDRDAARDHGADWLADPGVQSLSQAFTGDVEAGQPLGNIETRVRTFVSGDDPNRRIFAALSGFDRAFAHVHPHGPVRGPGGLKTPAALIPLQAHVAATGRLDSGNHGGALVPRLVQPGRALGEPGDERDLFHYVLRVPADAWDACDVIRLSEAHQLHRHEFSAGLTVACVPVIADPAELIFEQRPERGAYRIAPADSESTLARIESIVTNLDSTGALLAIAPELTLSPAILRRWQQVLAARRATRLRWVLAGTGAVDTRGGRPTNAALLLDGRTGQIIGRQDKLNAFDFTPQELARWGLESRLGKDALTEDIARGKRLTVFDAGAARMAILVCEDLGSVVDLAPVIRDLGISHVLTPIFGRPIKGHRWEQQAADVHARTTGSTVIVANSMVIRSITGTEGGTALVVPRTGNALIGSAIDPAQPICFRLSPDGSAKQV